MNRNEIFEQLKDILVSSDSRYTQVISTCTEATNVRTELGLSSTGMLYVLIAMEEICAQGSGTILLITHNPEIARIADKVIVMKQGNIESITENAEKESAKDLEW